MKKERKGKEKIEEGREGGRKRKKEKEGREKRKEGRKEGRKTIS